MTLMAGSYRRTAARRLVADVTRARSSSVLCCPSSVPVSHSCRIELRLLAGAVTFERARVANRIGPLENPVLPSGETREYFRFHGLRPGETQIGFQSAQGIGRKTRAFLQEHADLILPIDVIERDSYETQILPRLRI